MISLEKIRKLLYVLMTSEEPLTGSHLSNAMGISLKSFQNSLQEYNSILESKEMEIVSNKAKGYVLEYRDQKQYDELKNFIVNNHLVASLYLNDQQYRVNDLVRTLLCHENGVSLVSYAEKKFYSESTVNKDIRYVKKFLAKYDLKLVNKRQNGFRISGNEFAKRCCMVDELEVYRSNSIFLELDQEFEYLFGLNSRFHRNVEKIVEEEVKKTDISLPYYALLYVTYWIVLGKSREFYIENMKFTKVQMEELEKSCSFSLADRIYQRIDESSGLHYDIRNVYGLTAMLDCCREDHMAREWLFDRKGLVDYMHAFYPEYYVYDSNSLLQDHFLNGIQQKLIQILNQQNWHVFCGESGFE